MYSGLVLAQADMNNTPSFVVDDVETAKELLPIIPADTLLFEKFGEGVVYRPEEMQSKQFVECNIQHSFLGALHIAYAEHRPFVLSPEAFWLCITQGVSMKLKNENFNTNENKAITQDKQIIQIRNDDVALDENPDWTPVVNRLRDTLRILNNIENVDFFVPHFSETSLEETNVFTITLMESLENQFGLRVLSGCGIPKIYLSGSIEDWIWIKSNVQKLRRYNMQAWAEILTPLVDEILNAKRGSVNTKFWQNIYKSESVYTQQYISGWVLKLFPFRSIPVWMDGDDGFMAKDSLAPNLFMKGTDYLASNLTLNDLPMGNSKVNFEWDNRFISEKKEMDMHGGFLLVYQHSNKALEPYISWCLTEGILNSRRNYFWRESSMAKELDHDIEKYWSHNFVRKPKIMAQPKFIKCVGDSCSYQYVEAFLEKTFEKKKMESQGLRLSIEVLMDGQIYKVEFEGGKLDLKEEEYVRKKLHKEFPEWIPAKDDRFAEGVLWDHKQINNVLRNVNSTVEFSF